MSALQTAWSTPASLHVRSASCFSTQSPHYCSPFCTSAVSSRAQATPAAAVPSVGLSCRSLPNRPARHAQRWAVGALESPESAGAEAPAEGGEDVRAKLLSAALQRLGEADIQEAAAKWKLQDELFQEIDFAQVDAFTDKPFGGNPAAVCYLPYFPESGDGWLQLIAREFNLSETAFVVKRRQKKKKKKGPGPIKGALGFGGKKAVASQEEEEEPIDEFDLRWFTPSMEVELCGHATLAAAHLLFSVGIAESEKIRFHTKSGVLTASRVGSQEVTGPPAVLPEVQVPTSGIQVAEAGLIELDFPLMRAEEAPELRSALSEALGTEVQWAGRSTWDAVAVLASEAEVHAVSPDMQRVRALQVRGLSVTAAAAAAPKDSQPVDFVSRFFAPSSGIDEDPVTGSAHCTLGPYWAAALGKSELQAYQCSERGGRVGVRVDEEKGRVYLQGKAVVVMAGMLRNTHQVLRELCTTGQPEIDGQPL